MSDHRVTLTGELALDSLDGFVAQLAPLWDPLADVSPACFDLGHVRFIQSAAITLLAAAVLRLRQDGFPVSVIRPTSDRVDGYLNRIDFYALAEMDVDYAWPCHSSAGRFREVVQVQSESEGDAVVREVMEIIDRNVSGAGAAP